MKRFLIAIFMCIMLFVTLGSSAEASAIRECGDPAGMARNLTTINWTCSQGRSMVSAWYRGYKGQGVKWTERVKVRNCTTITDVRATMSGGFVTRFQVYGRACD